MEYNELLYDFVDGVTDSGQEQTLFAALAENEELRSDLKQLLAMRAAVQNDTKAFIPPASSTLSLFSSLGFSAPVAVVPVEVGIGAKILEFLGNSSKAITTGVVMSGITALCMYFWMKDSAVDTSSLVAENTSSITSEHTTGIKSSATKTTSSANSSQLMAGQDHTTITPPERIIKYVYIREKNSTSDAQRTAQSALETTPPNSTLDAATPQADAIESMTTPRLIPAEYQASSPAFIPSIAAAATPRSASFQAPSFVNLPSENSLPLWTLELRRLDTRSSETPTLVSTAPTYNNLALTGLFSLNSSFFVGLEFAQEQYFQSFTSSDTRGNTYLYEQNPSLSSLSVVARYVPFEWQKFQPILQLGLGGTAIGPIGRGLIGVRYSPEDNVSFMLNLEGSAMQYSHQNINYTLTKFGLSYGISLHF
jgi:hypothetical protein